MIEQFKRIDGIYCLGEQIKVRRVGEETTQTNAQAAVIALTALNDITGKKKQAKPGVREGNPTNAEIEVGEPEPAPE